jgi:hypothetical protein
MLCVLDGAVCVFVVAHGYTGVLWQLTGSPASAWPSIEPHSLHSLCWFGQGVAAAGRTVTVASTLHRRAVCPCQQHKGGTPNHHTMHIHRRQALHVHKGTGWLSKVAVCGCSMRLVLVTRCTLTCSAVWWLSTCSRCWL